MFFHRRKNLAHSIGLLNEAVRRDLSLEAIEEIVHSHSRPGRLAEVLRRVLAFEAGPIEYNSKHNYREQRKYNHLCDFEASLRISEALSLYFGRYDLADSPSYDQHFVREHSEKLDEQGYSLIENCVSPADCQRIIDFLGQEQLLFREGLSNKLHRGYTPENVKRTTSNVCWIEDRFALLSCPEIAALAFNPSLISVAQDFLGAPPIHTQITCWWSTPYSDSPEHVKSAAQQFHQDRDYIKFVKIFIYLTDVGAENGPHEFIAGSNADYAAVTKNKLRSSKRLTDEYLASVYARDRFRKFVAPRGTVLFEDTSGFHKGNPVVEDHRLMLQLEFASTLYGSPSYHFRDIPTEHLPPEARRLERLLSAYRASV